MSDDDIRAEIYDSWRKEPGPWQGEPDRKEWRHRGYACLIVRGPMGALCGYVGTPPGHPWHGKGYRKLEADVDCHGGLTYSGPCRGEICHVTAEGEPEVWWHGFDCNHAWDLAPAMLMFDKRMRDKSPEYDAIVKMAEEAGFGAFQRSVVYRDIAYVTHEVERLAEQAFEAGG